MTMTQTISHHLTDALLMGYSAGTLPEAFSLVVATHISMCDECRARAATFDTVGGAMLETSQAVAMDEGSLEATMARISAAQPVARGNGAAMQAGQMQGQHQRRARGVLPAPLQEYVGGDLEQINWRPVGMGVRQALLPTSRSASVRLLYIPAGASVPDHGHRGLELTLVLQGAFMDGDLRFGPGDIEIATEELEHTRIAAQGADCICLAATDAPLRFRALMPRLAQPFLRI